MTTNDSKLLNSNGELKSWLGYLLFWITTNGMIWIGGWSYLQKSPTTFTSHWAINVPGAKSYTNVNVPGIGQAVSSSDSPYGITSDPRENYKFLVQSEEVLKIAANELNIPVGEFAKPRVNIVDNTTLIKFEIKGNSPQQAQNKALALQKALQTRLSQLRKEEITQEDKNLEVALDNAAKKLRSSQQNLSLYKARSGLISSQQLQDLSVNLEALRRKDAETSAQLEATNGRFKQLSASLGLSSEEAIDALTLQTDTLFQQYLADYSQASAEVVNLKAKFLSTHPQVQTKELEKNGAKAALLKHGLSILGKPVSESILKKLNLNRDDTSSQRASLFGELISLQAQQQGLKGELKGLKQQINQLETRLKNLSQQDIQLENLQRNVRIAETIFSSTLTKLDLSKSNISASYPNISILQKPSLPTEKTEPKSKLILLGAAMASIFVTAGTISLLLRSRKQKQVFAKENMESKPHTTSQESLHSVRGQTMRGKK